MSNRIKSDWSCWFLWTASIPLTMCDEETKRREGSKSSNTKMRLMFCLARSQLFRSRSSLTFRKYA